MTFYQIQPIQIPVIDPNNVGQYVLKTASYATFTANYQPFQTTLPFLTSPTKFKQSNGQLLAKEKT